jgi:hypothetical protein
MRKLYIIMQNQQLLLLLLLLLFEQLHNSFMANFKTITSIKQTKVKKEQILKQNKQINKIETRTSQFH